jgi:ubiquinone/menaquinone biosynthesis C-methylase UbiE
MDEDGLHGYPAKTRYQQRDVAITYDEKRFSSWLGKLVDKLDRRALKRALSRIPIGGFLLDLPCGTGRMTEFLLREGYRVAGADISREMMDIARKRLESFAGFRGLFIEDAEDLSFENGEFDGLVCARLMGHVPPEIRIRMLKEMKRVTRGTIVVAYYVYHPVTEVSKWIQSKGKKRSPHLHPVKSDQMQAEVGAAGLRIVRAIPMLKYISECTYLVLERV